MQIDRYLLCWLSALAQTPHFLCLWHLAEVVAANAEKLIDSKRMPNDGIYDKKEYKYDYTGDIAYVKVDNLSGDFSAYVVAVTIVSVQLKKPFGVQRK